MAILRDAAENKILDPLRTHNWTGSIEREFPDGVIIGAERGGHRHTVALIYSSATDNGVYKSLSAQVEHIFSMERRTVFPTMPTASISR